MTTIDSPTPTVRGRGWPGWLSLPTLGAETLVYIAVGVIVVWPLATLLWQATADSGVAFNRLAISAATRNAVVNTLVTSLAATALSLVIGAALAIALARLVVPGARWLQVGLVLPILIPPFISAVGFTSAYGPAGLSDRWFGVQLPGLFGPVGIIVLLTIQGIPLVTLTVSAALASRGAADLERAARASGASAWTTLRTVTLPLL
ncbi:MAG: ABC transporter permease subunit, partial [Dehalococcoidia bacterium]|nr:ABC transporter permease subunit [Dehalococcoidia bacterium]